MKKIRFLSIYSAFLMLTTVTSCGRVTEEPADVGNPLPAETTAYEETSGEEETSGTEPVGTPVEPLAIADATIYFSGMYANLDEKQMDELSGIYPALTELSWQEITLYEDLAEWRMTLNEEFQLSRVRSENGWVIVDDSMHCYADNASLNAFVAKALASENNETDSGTETYFSIPCSEPDTEDEYRETAEQLLEAWLTSLQSNETEDYYRNTGFTISKPETTGAYTSQKNNYLACGMVNGVKEFCVELCFTAEDCGDNTFYDKYYQEGRYTAAGKYWSGQYICGRFRWENGICTLIDIATRDGSDRMQQGLNGISKNTYRNFFDFARQPDLDELTAESFRRYGSITVSSNLTMTMDGRQVHIDVYGFSTDREDAETVTAVMDERSYSGEEMLYSSGLYYTDYGVAVKSLTLPKNFKLTFDNYDNDGNPDYCVKYDEDENGSYYVLESLQTDGRIFNLSGRAYSGGIYLAGCYEASPRLQRTEDISYIGWKYENGSYYPTDSYGNPTELPALHMYSDRCYLPDDMKIYDEDETTVHCFLWNNTDAEVRTDAVYAIEMYERGEWVTVADGLQGSAVSIAPRGYADIAYDISSVTDRANTVYRIAQNCGGETAYGNFWSSGREVQTMKLTSVSLAEGALCGEFEYTNLGMKAVSFTSAVIRSGSEIYPLLLTDGASGTQKFLLADGKGLPAGSYTLIVDDKESMDFSVGADFASMKIDISAERMDSEVQVSFTPQQDCYLIQLALYRLKDRDWQLMTYSIDNQSYDGSGSLKAGTPVSIKMTNGLLDGMWAEYMYEAVKEYYEESGELPEGFEEYGIDYEDGMTPEEFQKIMVGNNSVQEEDALMILVNVMDEDDNSLIMLKKMEE